MRTLPYLVLMLLMSGSLHAQSFSMSMPNRNFVLIPGGAFETHALVTVDPGQTVHLSALHQNGLIAYFQPSAITQTQVVYLLVICPDSTLAQHQTLTAIARQGNDSITQLIDVYNANDGHGFYNVDRARAYLDTAFDFLEQAYPSQAAYLETVHQNDWQGCFPYPPLLVVTHHLFVDGDWRVEVLWHEMIPPDDWTKIFIYNESLSQCWGVLVNTLGQYSVTACEITHYIFQDTITGIEAPEPMTGFDVFPNPCRDKLWVSFKDELTSEVSVELFDLNGRKLCGITRAPVSANLTLDVGQFPRGMYVLCVRSANAMATRKVVLR